MRPKLPNGCGPRGADMGRQTNVPEYRGHRFKLYLRNILTGDDGAYDETGAYWGIGKPIFWAHKPAQDKVEKRGFTGNKHMVGRQYTYTCSDSEAMEINIFLRATDRDEAKREILKLLPNAIFYS